MLKKVLFIISLFFINTYCFAEEIDSYATASLGSDPSSTVGGCVNAITGDFVFFSKDLVADGADSISLNHIYTSRFRNGNYCAGFIIPEHLFITSFKNCLFAITEPSGIKLEYNRSMNIDSSKALKQYCKNDIELKLNPKSLKGIANSSNLENSGKLNIKNNKVFYNYDKEEIRINCADGGKRYYSFQTYSLTKILEKKYKGERPKYFYSELYDTLQNQKDVFFFKLDKEQLSNGNWIFYSYDNAGYLTGVQLTNPSKKKNFASVNIQYDNDIVCKSSNNQELVLKAQIKKEAIEIPDGWDKKKQKVKKKTINKIKSIECSEKICPESPDEKYDFLESFGKVIKDCRFPDNRHIHLEYYTIGEHIVHNQKINIANEKDLRFMRVKSLSVTYDEKSFSQTLYQFIYHLDDWEKDLAYTEVFDSKNNKTIYRYSKDLMLTSIEKYDQKNLINIESFTWGKTDSTEATFLLAKAFYDSHKKPLYAKRFFYDDKGNVVEERLYGNLSGNCLTDLKIENGLPTEEQTEVFSKKRTFSQDGKNLLLKEANDSGLITIFSYHNDTDKISSKLTAFNNANNIIKRKFYLYDNENILIETIEDNGSSNDKDNLSNVSKRLRKIIHLKHDDLYGMTDFIEIFYRNIDGKEKLLRKEKYKYNDQRKIISKEIISSDNKSKYTINYDYDAKGNLIYETDPLNRKAVYEFDKNNNKVYEKSFLDKEYRYHYDLCNRLILKESNNIYSEKFVYDSKDNKIQDIDIYGNRTNYEYDALGNITAEQRSLVKDTYGDIRNPVTKYSYDDFGRQIEKIDSSNNKTVTFYNSLSKPTLIIYPDETQEKFEYYLNGNLKSHINQENTITEYEYDPLKRISSKKIIFNDQVLRHEVYKYDGIDLIEKIDTDNNITKYFYDGAQRKVKEEIYTNKNELIAKEEFFYNELGFLNKKIENDLLITCYELDNAGRILEEKVENNHYIISKVKYKYDNADNKIRIINFIDGKESIEKRSYDFFDRLIEIEDAYNNKTLTEYDDFYKNELDQFVKKATTINAIDQSTTTIYDSLNREIRSEKKNPYNETVSLEEKYYDLNNNLTQQISTIFNLDRSKRQVVTLWQYDNMGRIISTHEAHGSKDEKITKYCYTKTSLLESTLKPDGTKIINKYDPIGNKINVFSSSNDISYEFKYNNLNQIVKYIDHVNNITISRKYDIFGNLLEDSLLDKWTIKNTYDLFGNKTKCILPDNSYIEYIYDPVNLKTTKRYGSDNRLLYQHDFLKYDLSNNLLKEKLINGSEIEYEINFLAQVRSINTEYHQQHINYDSIGRISNISWEGLLSSSNYYEYDDLNQIRSETGDFEISYEHDSHFNRIKKNNDNYQINDLNELISTGDNQFSYDLNGNPISQNKNSEKIFYYYDSLDRLVKVEKSNVQLEFLYDPLNRRILKKAIYNNNPNNLENTFYFLYDEQNEIGSFDKNNQLKELRVLSSTDTAEIGSAISFEIDDNLYIPIYDISGNVISLIFEKSILEHYRYSVFGERKRYNCAKKENTEFRIRNPWQYSSKRIDEETGLIYFGRRYYDPDHGRWITADPEGFTDGLNLYAFVLNDPLTHIDLYGLYANPYMFPKSNPYIDEAAKGIFAGAGNFTTNFITSNAGSNDDFIHWDVLKEYNNYQQREVSRNYINQSANNWMRDKLHADFNSPIFQNFEKWTDRALTASTLFFAGKNIYSGIKAEVSFNRSLQVNRGMNQWHSQNLDFLATNKNYSGFDLLGKTKSITVNQLKKLIQAGSQYDRGGLTRAGRALAKHGRRKGSVFPQVTGSPKDINKQGQKILENILKDQNVRYNKNRFGGMDIFSSEGKGVRFDEKNNFMGFLQPKK